MTPNKSFNHFVNTIFGENTINLDETSQYSNNIIGAVRNFYQTGQYAFFSSNLKGRLYRLYQTFKDDNDKLQIIISKIRNLADDNWMGYYAELTAYDFFSLMSPLELEITLPIEETYAQFVEGRQASSLDGSLINFSNQKFEVKCFSDVVKQILDNIKDRLINRGLFAEISVNYPNDLDPQRLQRLIPDIRRDLQQCSVNQDITYCHPDLPEVRFNLHYTGQRLLISEHTYEPYRHAEALKYFIINHFDQFQINQPNLLVYVVHPWFNLNINDFANHKEIFLRSFCRRVFCQLSNDTTQIRNLLPNRYPNVTLEVREVIRKLTHILFIIDNNVEPQKYLNSNDLLTVMEGYLYSNPNIDQVNRSLLIDDLSISNSHVNLIRTIENFSNDNY